MLKTVCALSLLATVASCTDNPGEDDDAYASDGKEDGTWTKLKSGPISYKRFTTTVLRLTATTKSKQYLYLGDHAGAQCSMSLSYSGGGGSYSEADFDVRSGADDDDGVSGVQIQYVAKLSVNRLEEGKFDFHVVDTTCHGEDDATVTYASDFANPREITAISTTVRESGCHEGGPITTHERACENLAFVFSPTYTNVQKVTALMKADLGATTTEGRRITASRFGGCGLNLAKSGNLDCSWDVSDDPEGDTGDIEHGIYKVVDGAPTELVETFTEDKW